MINIAVAGAAGRMGRHLAGAAEGRAQRARGCSALGSGAWGTMLYALCPARGSVPSPQRTRELQNLRRQAVEIFKEALDRSSLKITMSLLEERAIQPRLANDRCQGAGFEVLVHGDRDGACGFPNLQLHDSMASTLPDFHESMPLQKTAHCTTRESPTRGHTRSRTE